MDWFVVVRHGNFIGFDMTPDRETARNTVRHAAQAGELMLVPVPAERHAHATGPHGYYRIPFEQAESIQLRSRAQLPAYLGFAA